VKPFVILIAFALSGCITASYHTATVEFGHAYREFDRDHRAATRMYTGTMAGRCDINGEGFHRFQFAGILKGAGRYLDVLVPERERMTPAYETGPDGILRESKRLIKRSGLIRIRESATPAPPGPPAYLAFTTMSTMTMKTFTALMNQEVGKPSDPISFLNEHFSFAVVRAEYPLAIIHLDFSLNYSYSARAVIWGAPADGSSLVICTGIAVGPYTDPHFDIAWKERSRIVYAARMAGYVGTVIADVVTSPVQLVMTILTALTGPGVR